MYVTGKTIKELREKEKLTQKELAMILNVSDKTISKWETERGLPDISLLEDIAKALHITIAELLTGDVANNQNKSANYKKGKFYVCPICGNILHSVGEGVYSCCGVRLMALEVEEMDKDHELKVESIGNEYYVTMNHEMNKNHYISFMAYVTDDKVSVKKLYPEGASEASFLRSGHGMIYAYCNHHGLYAKRV